MTYPVLYSLLAFYTRVDDLMRSHPTTSLVVLWTIGMLSYHQDVNNKLAGFAMLSQVFAIICLVALISFGFTQREWLNFLIAPPLAWLHIQFTMRWRARPGAWW
jgi:hypothetical protein